MPDTVVVTLVLTGLAASTVVQLHTAQKLHAARRDVEERVQLLRSRMVAPPAQATDDTISPEQAAQLRRQAAQVHRLQGDLVLLRQQERDRTAVGSRPMGKADREVWDDPEKAAGSVPMERMDLTRKLRQQGRPADALQHYLWCFDEGMKADPSFAGVRLSFLLQTIASLGNSYPSTREALQARRDQLGRNLQPGSSQAYSGLEFTALNEKLGEPLKNLSVVDQLPADSPSRTSIFRGLTGPLKAEQRYAELVSLAAPEEVFADQLATLEQLRTRPESKPTAGGAQAALHRALVLSVVAGSKPPGGCGLLGESTRLGQQPPGRQRERAENPATAHTMRSPGRQRRGGFGAGSRMRVTGQSAGQPEDSGPTSPNAAAQIMQHPTGCRRRWAVGVRCGPSTCGLAGILLSQPILAVVRGEQEWLEGHDGPGGLDTSQVRRSPCRRLHPRRASRWTLPDRIHQGGAAAGLGPVHIGGLAPGATRAGTDLRGAGSSAGTVCLAGPGPRPGHASAT